MARCTKIIHADTEDPQFIIGIKQIAKYVVDIADNVAPTDIEVGLYSSHYLDYEIFVPIH